MTTPAQLTSHGHDDPQVLEPERLAYTVRDATRVSSLGKTRLYSLSKEGKLKMIKVGKRTLVDAASLRELIRTGC